MIERRWDYRFGVLASILFSANAKQAKAPSDFFPSLASAPSVKPPKELTKAERQAAAKAFFAGLAGRA